MQNYLWLILPAALAGFVLFWSLVCWLIAQIGGWASLARHFRVTDTVMSSRYYLQTGEMNGSRYKGCLILGVATQGLYLSVLFAFRPGHPPLLIPWSCLSSFQAKKEFWTTAYTTTITQGAAIVRLTLYDRGVVDALQAQRALLEKDVRVAL